MLFRSFVIVLLDSAGKYTRQGDAQRVRDWLETGRASAVPKSGTKAAKVKTVAYTAPQRAKRAINAKPASSSKARA